MASPATPSPGGRARARPCPSVPSSPRVLRVLPVCCRLLPDFLLPLLPPRGGVRGWAGRLGARRLQAWGLQAVLLGWAVVCLCGPLSMGHGQRGAACVWGGGSSRGGQEATNTLPPFKSPFSANQTHPNCGGPSGLGRGRGLGRWGLVSLSLGTGRLGASRAPSGDGVPEPA